MAALVLCSATSLAGLAQTFPDRPIKLVVAIPAGGAVDGLARILAEGAGKRLGQNVVVENRIGGSGAIAVQHVIKQPADGYTVYLTANAAFSLIPLVRKMPYRPLEDFSFIGRLAFAPNVIAIPARLPATTLQEFVALAKSKPGQLNYGTMLGVPQHIDFERFKRATGTQIVLVPYPGGPTVVNAMLGGQVDVTLFNAALFTEWVKSGKVRALATTASKRIAAMPDVPTLAEAGLADVKLDEGNFYALVGPAGMPAPIMDKLYRAFADVVNDPSTRKRFEEIGFEASLKEGEAFKKDLQRELVENERMVKTLDIKLTD